MVTWTKGSLEISEGHLSYHRIEGKGPTLVLSHGLTDNGLCWMRLAKTLAADFDVIMLDARGHGESSRIQDGQAFDPGRDIAEAIDQLGLEAPLVLGHSIGARAVADYAASCPEGPSKVILEDPAFMPPLDAPTLERRRAGFRRQVEAYSGMSRADLLDLGHKHHPTWQEDEFPAWIDAKTQVDRNAMPVFARAWQDTVAKIKVPTLIVHGEAKLGSLVSPEIAIEARALNGHLTTVEITGAGHNTRRENFEGYLEAVITFLNAP